MTRLTTQCLARLLTAGGVIVFGRALAAHHPDPTTAAESAYLSIVAGAVLGLLVLCSRATAAVVASGVWISICLALPAASGTRGSFVVAGLVAAVVWATWRALAGDELVDWLDVGAITFAWQALLRSGALLTSSSLAAVPGLLGPPLLLAAAAIQLGGRCGGRRALTVLAPLLLLSTDASLVPAVALLALAVADPTRPARWPAVAALGGGAALALGRWPGAGAPLLVLVAALALRRRRGWRWLPLAAALVWTIARWSGPPVALTWIVMVLPFAAFVDRDHWPTLATGGALAAGHAAGLDPLAQLAPALVLVAASVPHREPALSRQAAWGLALLSAGCLAVAYPWLRQPLALLPERSVGLAAAVVLPLALACALACAGRLRWGNDARRRVRTAWLSFALLALLAAPLALSGRLLLGDSIVLNSAAGEWSRTTGGSAIRYLAVDTFLMNSAGVADGAPVATVRLVMSDGRRYERALLLGRHTADWAARRLDQRHPKAWLGWVAADGSLAQRYRATWHFSPALHAVRIDIVRAEGLPDVLEIALLQVTAR
jgi:hypothetical protein